MAFISRRVSEDALKEMIGEPMFNEVMKFFKANPRKTTFKIKAKDGRIVIYKYAEGAHVKYTATLL